MSKTYETVKNQSNKQIITWGTGEFKTDRSDVTYIRCKSEKSLIMEFMKFWIKNYPDVITGWNTKFFDGSNSSIKFYNWKWF